MATQTSAGPDGKIASRKIKTATPFASAIPMATIGLVATAIGFLPTFFMRLSKVDVPHLIHGWTMIGWLLVALAQALLIRTRRFRAHRLLGWSAVVLFAGMVGSSLQMLALMLSGKSGLPFEAARFFGWSDIADLPLLLILFGSAIHFRRDRHLHSRLVASTVLISMVPALARFFNILIWRSFEGLFTAMHPTYLLILGVLGISILRDRRSGRLEWSLPLAFAWFGCVYAAQWPVWHAPAYIALCQWIAGFA